MHLSSLLLLLAAPLAAAGPGAAPAVLHGHRGAVFFLAFPARDLLLSAAEDGARAWNPETGKLIEDLSGPSIAAAYSARAGLLAVSRADGSIVVYDSSSWTEAAELRDTGGLSLSLAFSEDGEFLAASGADGRARSWKTSGWEPGPGLAAYPGPFLLAGYTGGGNTLATFSAGEPLLRFWDLSSGKLLYWLKSPHTLSAFYDQRGGRLAAAAADRTLRVWEPGRSGQAPSELETGPLAAAAFSTSGNLLAAGGLDGSITVWDPGRGAKAGEIRDSRIRAASLAFSPSGLYLASGEAGGEIALRMWAAEVWTSSGGVPVKNAGGTDITLLPAGVRLGVLKAPPGAAHWLVSDGTGLSGWAPAAALAAERPDLSPPIIRITSQSYSAGALSVKGAVLDDGRLAFVRFSGKDLPRPPAVPGAPSAGGWPFEISVELTPDTVPLLEAGDLSGKTSRLALNLRAAGADYAPGYLLLRPEAGAGIFRKADASSPLLARAAAGSVLAALGKRGAWYLLEGGGWLKAAKPAGTAGFQAPAVPLFIADSSATGPGGREVTEEIPQGRANPRALAVVIGVKDYLNSDIPRADYALEDAAAVRRHLVKALGFDEDKVLYLENPTKGQLETFFGGSGGGGRLRGLVKKGETELFVYYSGHGAADPEAGAAYLVPADARPDYLRLGGFPLARLYASLEGSGAAQVTVVIEACFSGLSPAGPLLGKASPLILAARRPEAKKINIFSSSAADQVSSWYPAAHRGLFTYYFLKALRENCCGPGPLRLGTLKEITGAEVPATAMRLYGRTQTPLFTGDPQAVLSR